MFLAILVLLGVGSALWFGVPMYRQYSSFRAMRAAGGGIGTTKGGPAWLRKSIGDERMQIFDAVYQVGIQPFSDADFARFDMSVHKDIRVLILNGTEITDAGMADIGKMTKLAHLYLEDTQITDRGLNQLTGIKELETLWLARTKVSDAGVGELKRQLPKLTIFR